jgi:hypothetical protein
MFSFLLFWPLPQRHTDPLDAFAVRVIQALCFLSGGFLVWLLT